MSTQVFRTKGRLEVPESARNALQKSLVGSIVASNYLPAAAINGSLVVGSSFKPDSCAFPLPTFLILTGAFGTGLLLMTILVDQVVAWILSTGAITKGTRTVLIVLKAMGSTLLLAKLGLLVAMSAFVFSKYSSTTYDRAEAERNPSLLYCDYTLHTFTVFFVLVIWSTFAVVGGCWTYLVTKDRSRPNPTL